MQGWLKLGTFCSISSSVGRVTSGRGASWAAEGFGSHEKRAEKRAIFLAFYAQRSHRWFCLCDTFWENWECYEGKAMTRREMWGKETPSRMNYGMRFFIFSLTKPADTIKTSCQCHSSWLYCTVSPDLQYLACKEPVNTQHSQARSGFTSRVYLANSGLYNPQHHNSCKAQPPRTPSPPPALLGRAHTLKRT